MKIPNITFISRSLVAVAMFAGVATVALPVTPAYASADDANTAQCNTDSAANTGIKSGIKCAKSADQKGNLGNVLEVVTNVLLFIIGAIAVIMIIIGGIKYTISNGDSAQITSAKNTILYAVIGLIVALLAYAIVNFVIDSFVKPAGVSALEKTTS